MDPQEVQFTVGKPVIPQDHFTIEDKERGELHFVRNGETYKEVTKDRHEPFRVHQDREYTMSDSESFVKAIRKCKADPAKGIIFYYGHIGQNNTTVTMLFDETNRKEKITLPLKTSLEIKAFFNDPKDPGQGIFDQKAFLKLIDTFPECVAIDDFPIFRAMVEKIKLSTKIDFESNVNADALVFYYQETTGGDQTGRLPKKLTLRLPFYEGSRVKMELDVELEITKPKTAEEKPAFKLINVKHERTEKSALTAEIATLQLELEGWEFVNGK